MADYQYGLNCIVAKVKSERELDLKFVLNRKQYTVTYKEKKDFDGGRDLSQLLSASDALKASIWNVPSGIPGSTTRSWYVTDIWNPNIAGMEKSRLPEPTISIVCKISHLLGQDYFLCEVGKHFTKDIIVLPRNLVQSVMKNSRPEIGDYLLVFSLIIWEILDGSRISRLVPLWAYWDNSNCALASTAHLNIVERGPENSTLLIPDQIPSTWGVVQRVHKKSLKVYVPCIVSSVSVPFTAIYQYDREILEEDWLQLWLTPQMNGNVENHFSKVSNWICSSCCWFGRAKKRYEVYLQERLSGHYVKYSSPPVVGPVALPSGATATAKRNAPSAAQQAPSKLDLAAGPPEIGIGKVSEVREKSGVLKCQRVECEREHVFHMGLMTIYGVKMASIKSAKMKDLVEMGSELRYRMNPINHHLRAVWIGPEYVTFKYLNFLPQLHVWIKKRNLSGAIVEEMMKDIMDNSEAISKAAGETKVKTEVSDVSKGGGPMAVMGESRPNAGGPMVVEETPKGGVAQRRPGDGRNDEFDGAKYSKEEEEELEKLWWSEDSEESEDELAPVLSPSGELLADEDEMDDDKDPKEVDLMSVDKEYESLEKKMNPNRPLDVVEPLHQPKMETHSIENRGQDSKKSKTSKGSLLMLVLMELTKFLVEKGKSETVADACEVSAEFVARLEKALEEVIDYDSPEKPPLTQSVGLQAGVSSALSPVQSDSLITHLRSLSEQEK